MAFNFLDKTGLGSLINKIKVALDNKVDKEEGKGLSQVNFTNELYDKYEGATDSVNLIAAADIYNKINTISVNGEVQPIDEKNVNIQTLTSGNVNDLIDTHGVKPQQNTDTTWTSNNPTIPDTELVYSKMSDGTILRKLGTGHSYNNTPFTEDRMISSGEVLPDAGREGQLFLLLNDVLPGNGVVSEGVIDSWSYIKFANGLCLMYVMNLLVEFPAWEGLGSLYWRSQSITIPMINSTIFTSFGSSGVEYAYWTRCNGAWGSTSVTVQQYSVNSNPGTTQRIQGFVVGKWK